jgi:uncharacterized protein
LILLDANVLVYALNADSPQHPDCLEVVQRAASGGLPGVLVPQVLIECYSVVTSPRRMARPLSSQQARTVVRSLARSIEVKPVPATLLEDVDLMLAQHPRRGQGVFDLVLAAQMISHGIRAICTCDAEDFGIPGIRAVGPTQTLAAYD